MVLAFFGAGMLNLSNAIGVIIGTNIGTTFTESLLGAIGLTYSISQFALPVIAVGGLGMMIFARFSKIKNICLFLV